MKCIKRIILIVLVAAMMFSFVSCGDSDECSVCCGSGYYQKKDCPFC